MERMLIQHRKLFNTLEGFVRNLCCNFPKSSNQTWIWWKIVLLFQSRMLRIAWKMNSSTFGTTLGPNTCSKLIKFVILAEGVWRLSKCLKRSSPIVTSLPRTHLCESVFPTLLHVKAKSRNRFNFTPEDNLRCALSTRQSRIHNLVENVTQEQKSNWSLSRGLLCVADANIEYNLMYYRKAHILFAHICAQMKTE